MWLCVSLRVRLLTQSRGFFRGLLSSPSREVAVAARISARDIRTNLGSNLALIRRETNLDPWETDRLSVKSALHFAEMKEIPAGDEWRSEYLSKLLNEMLYHKYNGNIDEEKKILTLINSLVANWNTESFFISYIVLISIFLLNLFWETI